MGMGQCFITTNICQDILVTVFLDISKTRPLMHCSALWVTQVTYSINAIKNVCFPSAGNNLSFANFSFHVARTTLTLYILDTALWQSAILR